MPRPRSNAAPSGGIPNDVPNDGTPLTVTETRSYKKELGDPPGGNKQADAIDLENQDWLVDKLGHDGFQNIDVAEGRPYAPQLRESYGPGKYRVTPMGLDGKPIQKLSAIVNVGSPVQMEPDEPDTDEGNPGIQLPGTDDMPAYMRMQMWQMEMARKEDKERADKAEEKRLEREHEQRTKDYEREQRKEAADERRHNQELEDRKAAQNRTNLLITEGIAFATTLASGLVAMLTKDKPQAQPQIVHAPQNTDFTDKLLGMVLEQRSNRPSGLAALREQLEVVQMVDKLRQPLDDGRRDKDEDRDEDPMVMLAKLAPLVAMFRGQTPVPTEASGPDQSVLQGYVRQVLSDPDAVRAIAKENPKQVARVLMQAMKGDPALETAVMETLQEMSTQDAQNPTPAVAENETVPGPRPHRKKAETVG
jgi:hypothetical protein